MDGLWPFGRTDCGRTDGQVVAERPAEVIKEKKKKKISDRL